MRRPDRPTLEELRARVHKERHREIGNWLARRWARPTAVYGTWLAVRLGMSANQVTATAAVAGLGGAVGLGLGTPAGFAVGSLLLLLAFWLDRVDGQVARWRSTSSLDGVYLDYLMHHAHNLAIGFALGYGLAARTGDLRWTVAGLMTAGGWCLQSLHNDCRYKAFFQQLKRSSGAYSVRGGSGGAPQPPAPWPRRGVGILTWPLAKVCEPHVVLTGLVWMSVLAVAEPVLWELVWKGSMLGMALVAPVLGIGRVVRFGLKKSVSREFDAWFQVLGPEGGLQRENCENHSGQAMPSRLYNRRPQQNRPNLPN